MQRVLAAINDTALSASDIKALSAGDRSDCESKDSDENSPSMQLPSSPLSSLHDIDEHKTHITSSSSSTSNNNSSSSYCVAALLANQPRHFVIARVWFTRLKAQLDKLNAAVAKVTSGTVLGAGRVFVASGASAGASTSAGTKTSGDRGKKRKNGFIDDDFFAPRIRTGAGAGAGAGAGTIENGRLALSQVHPLPTRNNSTCCCGQFYSPCGGCACHHLGSCSRNVSLSTGYSLQYP